MCLCVCVCVCVCVCDVPQVKAEVRDVRSGLGSSGGGGGGGKRSLDGAGRESSAKHARLVKHYSQAVSRELDRSSKRQ